MSLDFNGFPLDFYGFPLNFCWFPSFCVGKHNYLEWIAHFALFFAGIARHSIKIWWFSSKKWSPNEPTRAKKRDIPLHVWFASHALLGLNEPSHIYIWCTFCYIVSLHVHTCLYAHPVCTYHSSHHVGCICVGTQHLLQGSIGQPATGQARLERPPAAGFPSRKCRRLGPRPDQDSIRVHFLKGPTTHPGMKTGISLSRLCCELCSLSL